MPYRRRQHGEGCDDSTYIKSRVSGMGITFFEDAVCHEAHLPDHFRSAAEKAATGVLTKATSIEAILCPN